MGIHSQVLHSINIVKLKNLYNVEIDFDRSPLTAIMGVNGCGKSTILYALACIYQPIEEDETSKKQQRKNNRNDTAKQGQDVKTKIEEKNIDKFTRYFPHTTHFDWFGSEFYITYSYWDRHRPYPNQKKEYKKGERWTRYYRRPQRYVKLINILDSCVPAIEKEKTGQKIDFTTEPRATSEDELIIKEAGRILNKDYEILNIHEYKNKKIHGVKSRELQYSALAMGAGEQRVFKILDTVFNAPNHSLILIDEIDLLMHPQALKRLIDVIFDRANEKKHQIIFTSHNTELFSLKDKVQIRYIYQANNENRTICMNNVTPDIYRRMTGKNITSIEIYVEDDLAQALVQKIANSLGISRHIQFYKYGSAENVFTISGGLALSQGIDHCLFVLDGDKYIDQDQKLKRIKKVITGTEETLENIRTKALENIKQFNFCQDFKPEIFIFKCLREMQAQDDSENEETRHIAVDIINAGNHHNLIVEFHRQLGCTREIGLMRLVELFSLSSQWQEFSEPIRTWLEDEKK